MKKQINEIRRMQQLAGIRPLNENQTNDEIDYYSNEIIQKLNIENISNSYISEDSNGQYNILTIESGSVVWALTFIKANTSIMVIKYFFIILHL